MTQDFKNILEDYITNNIVPTSQQSKTEFNEADVLSFTDWGRYLPSSYQDIVFNGHVVDEISNKVILYGFYVDENHNSAGIIVVLDETFKPIKSFFTFSNGVTLNPIQCMKQAEDGTYYFVDKATQLRFVMVNNFSSQNTNGEYILTFRKNYNFDNSFNLYTVRDMFKSGTSSKYVFFTSYVTSNSTIKITELEVNVGESPTWNSPVTISDKYFGGAYASFNDDGVFWRLIVTLDTNPLANVMYYEKDYTQTTPTSSNIAGFLGGARIYARKGQSVFLDENTVYFVSHSSVNNVSYTGLYKYSFNNNTLTTLYNKILTDENYDEYINLAICNNTIYIEYVTNITTTTGSLIPEENGPHGDYYFQRLINDTWNPVLYKNNEIFVGTQNLLIAKADFNLIQLYSWTFSISPTSFYSYILLLKDNYNVLNYNGLPYTDYNSAIPKQVEIYSNDSLVFARNIIDKTIIDNKTVSTTTIPNTYLNGIVLDKENLLTETNITTISQNVPITKNIYELIYLSFINSITNRIYGADSQTIDAQVPSNLNSYVTTNINTGTQVNSENTSMGMLVVNYADGTTLETNIFWTKENEQYKCTFSLYVQKEIASYEIKSNDLQQTYYEVAPLELEIGSTYKFTETFYVS